MVSEDECFRTIERNGYYVILPVLPELRGEENIEAALDNEYSSKDNNLSVAELTQLLQGSNTEIKRFIAGN